MRAVGDRGVQPGCECRHTTLTEIPTTLVESFRGSKCQRCSYSGKNQWLCLQDSCHFVGCGPKGLDHSGQHFELSGHPVSVNLHNSQAFCHLCDSRVAFVPTHEPASTTTERSEASSHHQLFEPLLSGVGDSLDTSVNDYFGVCGLPNLGNTCYMNAALQTLLNCPQLTEYFLQCSAFFEYYHTRLASYYQSFVTKVWMPPRPCIVSPLNILREVKSLYPTFDGYSQHDAQEFLRVFLNHLHDELKSTRCSSNNPSTAAVTFSPGNAECAPSGGSHNVSTSAPDEAGGCGVSNSKRKSAPHESRSPRGLSCFPQPHKAVIDATGDRQPIPAFVDGQSIITDVFQGKLISAVRCLSCKEVSCREEVFLDLSLSLRRPDSDQTVYIDLPGGELLKPASHSCHFESTSSAPDAATSYVYLSPQPNGPVSVARTKARPVKSTDHFGFLRPLDQLAKLRDSIPLARRFFLQLFGFLAMSASWLIAKWSDVQSWVVRPGLSLEDCLSNFFSQAELNGSNKYYCDRCKKLCNGINQTALVTLPEILCIHLKRFRSHSMVDASKITSTVTFPLSGLNLEPYLYSGCRDKITTYDLMSVICHRGGCGGGHYVTYALNWYQNKWYEFDDDRVTELSPDQVAQLTSEVYILFYRKRDTFRLSLRNEVDLVLERCSRLASTRTVYISRPWFVRFGTWAEPGPITNDEFLCEHGQVKPQLWSIRESALLPIPEELWSKLVNEFEGGPLVRDIQPCGQCYRSITDRQNRELLAFDHAYEEFEQISDSCGIYAISSIWFESWKDFVTGKSLNIPGKIDNSKIVEYRSSRFVPGDSQYYDSLPNTGVTNGSTMQPRLKMGASCTEVYEGCWEVLFDIYGGGPVICLRPAQPTSPASTREMETADAGLGTLSRSNSYTDRFSPLSSDANLKTPLSADSELHQIPLNPSYLAISEHLSDSADAVNKTRTASPSSGLANGDTESGFYSTARTTSSGDLNDIDRSFHSRSFSRLSSYTFSLSVEQLNSFGKGDWAGSFYPSAAALTVDKSSMHPDSFNGDGPVHAHSMEHLCGLDPSSPPRPLVTADGSKSDAFHQLPSRNGHMDHLIQTKLRSSAAASVTVPNHKRPRLSPHWEPIQPTQ